MVGHCSDESDSRNQRLLLADRCWRIDHSLQQWRDKVTSKLSGPVPSAILRETDDSAGESSQAQDLSVGEDTARYFRTGEYVEAQSLMLYWASCIVLYSSLRQNHMRIRSENPSLTPKDLPARTEVSQYAINIAKSVDYFIHPDMGFLGPQILTYPMGTALYHFSLLNDSETAVYKLRLLRAFGQIDKIGLSIGDFLKSIMTGYTAKTAGVKDNGADGWKKKAELWSGTNSEP